ncbi:hypothetical protein O6H91_09G053900 [Diphasiastrum complanatum]|nr:hypothetical protein O6H91_09G053900 [Diphasiastrum complanatum]
MKESELLKCQIQEWYPRFRRVSFTTNIHVLPESFISFLLQDGLFLPRSSEAMPCRTTATCPELQAEDYHHWKEEDEEDDEPAIPSFPELESKIKASIEQLGGSVIPKLNWSAPADTAWISCSGSLKCRNFDEISLLLKASDTLSHDLCHAFDACEDKTRDRPPVFVLALKKWYDLRPEMEFRAFVRARYLVGISQREVTSFYPSLLETEEYYGSLIADFFVDSLCEQFELENYAFDCYVTKDGKVKLMDFNTWGGSTLPLLYSWNELEEKHSALLENFEENHNSKNISSFAMLRSCGYRVEVRIVKNEGLVQPSFRANSGVPIDLVNKGPGSAWEEFVQKLEEDVGHEG